MADDGLYLWNQERALELAKSKPFVCRVCLEHVPWIQMDAIFRRTLKHVHGKKRKEIEELIDWFTNDENITSLAKCARHIQWDPKTIE
jgi:hypothetical protein